MKEQDNVILLLQKDESPVSRTYLKYVSIQSAFDALMTMFEQSLNENQSGYTISEIKKYLTTYNHVEIMEYRKETQDYINHGLNWIIKNISGTLKNQKNDSK